MGTESEGDRPASKKARTRNSEVRVLCARASVHAANVLPQAVARCQLLHNLGSAGTPPQARLITRRHRQRPCSYRVRAHCFAASGARNAALTPFRVL